MKKPIVDHEHLERETKSGAVLNKDSTALHQAKQRKQKRLEEKARLEALESTVRDLNTKIDALLTLVQEKFRSKE